MRWKKTLALSAILLALVTLLCAPTAHAQDYSFSLDQLEVNVWINDDGSVRLEYWLVFTCDPGAHPIDIVDLGLPNGDFRISDISAEVDGETPIDHVGSDFEGKGSDGVAIHLGRGTIAPGQTGTVAVEVERVGSMLYEDDNDPEYASVEFAPAYYVGTVHGTTDMTVRFFLPEGVQPEEPRWHKSPSGWPSEPETDLHDGRVMYVWYNPAADPSRQHTFGASFPRKYVSEGVIQQAPAKPLPGTGFIESIESGDFSCCGSWCIPCGFFAFFGGVAAISAWGQRKRKMQYLPPLMKVEGVGIKRGLTAVEASILLETPLNKVLTMILFGLLKKGAVTVLDDEPLKVQVNEPRPEKLRSYEENFLGAVKKDGALSETGLRKMMVAMVEEVGNKIKGFSRKETVAYYKDIVRRAWQQVETADTPEVRSQRFDEGLEWTMLDDDFDDRMGRTFTGPVYMPPWWIYYRPWASRVQPAAVSTGKATSSAPSGRGVQLPTLPGAAFAASIVTGVQSTASNIVRSVTGFTGDVTQVTNPPPKPSGRSYGSRGGGGGCACACACAGCACACAGGGR
ncbi:MAG: hypothetical protein JW918_17975 [Anaerolineae bacterium]|nr:hypothetical protein [Anaerolineae bacterium]